MARIAFKKCSVRELKSLRYTELWFFALWLSQRCDGTCGVEIHNIKALGSVMLGGKKALCALGKIWGGTRWRRQKNVITKFAHLKHPNYFVSLGLPSGRKSKHQMPGGGCWKRRERGTKNVKCWRPVCI